MPLVIHDGKEAKVACVSCINGHRSNKCTHLGRILIEVRRPGRPLASCPHASACRGECSQQPAFYVPETHHGVRCNHPKDIIHEAVKSDKKVDYPKTTKKSTPQKLKTQLIKIKPHAQHGSTCGAHLVNADSAPSPSKPADSTADNSNSNGSSKTLSDARRKKNRRQSQSPATSSCCGAAGPSSYPSPRTLRMPVRPSSHDDSLPDQDLPPFRDYNGNKVRMSMLGVQGPLRNGFDPVGWQGDWPDIRSISNNEQQQSFSNSSAGNVISSPTSQQQCSDMAMDNLMNNSMNHSVNHSIGSWNSHAVPYVTDAFLVQHQNLCHSNSSASHHHSNAQFHGQAVLPSGSMSSPSLNLVQQQEQQQQFNQQISAENPWTQMPSYLQEQFGAATCQVIEESVLYHTQGQQGQCLCDAGCRCVFCAMHPYNPATMDMIMNEFRKVQNVPDCEGSGGELSSSEEEAGRRVVRGVENLDMNDLDQRSMQMGMPMMQQTQAQIHRTASDFPPSFSGFDPAVGPVDFVSTFNMHMVGQEGQQAHVEQEQPQPPKQEQF